MIVLIKMYFYKDNGFFRKHCAFFCKKKQNKPYNNKKRDSLLLQDDCLRMLGYSDSNQEKQDQNLLCYHYTIAQTDMPISSP